jgi:peptidoglycan/LPS O-acetylase OafA/YrhL
MQGNRLIELDCLRGISAFLVMLYHYTTRYDISFGHYEPYLIYFSWGHMAVSIFFIISGFLIIMNVKQTDGILSFAYRRMIRLYPVYWAAIILTALFTYLWLPERASDLRVIAINFTMLQGFLGVSGVDGVYWFLRDIILFYAAIGLIVLVKQMKNISLICLGWVSLTTILTILNSLADNIFLNVISALLMPGYAHMFILGIAMYSLYQNQAQKIPHVIIGLCILNQYLSHGMGYSVFFIIVTAIFYGIAFKVRYKLVFQEQLLFLSSISYPLYLIHQFIGYGIIKHMESIGLINEIYLVIPITISIILAYLLHRYVEDPSGKVLSAMNPFYKKIKAETVME